MATRWFTAQEVVDELLPRKADGSRMMTAESWRKKCSPRSYTVTAKDGTRTLVRRPPLGPVPGRRVGNIGQWSEAQVRKWLASKPGRGVRTDLGYKHTKAQAEVATASASAT